MEFYSLSIEHLFFSLQFDNTTVINDIVVCAYLGHGKLYTVFKSLYSALLHYGGYSDKTKVTVVCVRSVIVFLPTHLIFAQRECRNTQMKTRYFYLAKLKLFSK